MLTEKHLRENPVYLLKNLGALIYNGRLEGWKVGKIAQSSSLPIFQDTSHPELLKRYN